jgi:hypothetical protein
MENFKLSIQTPCHERREDFTPTPTGGFCQSCQKNVRDFTNMDDSELVAFFRDNKTQNLCGSFRNDQLKRPLDINQWFPEWAIEANTALIELPINQIKTKSKIFRLPQSLRFAAAFALFTFSFDTSGQTQLIKGKVIDADDKSPLPGVSIQIKGKNKGVSTNTNGEYQIEIEQGDKLIFGFVGFEMQELKSNDNPNVKLKPAVSGFLVGDVAYSDSNEPTEGILDNWIEKMATKRALKKQNQTIRGKVIDQNDQSPIIGASIKIKDSQKGVLTNENGEYEIKAKKEDILIISSIGYKEQEIEAKDSKEVHLKEDAVALNEVVVVGYTVTKRYCSTGGVSVDKNYNWNPISYDKDPLEKQKIKINIALAANPTVGDETIIIPKFETEIADNQLLNKYWIYKNAFQRVHQVWVYDLSGRQFPIRYEKLHDGAIKLNLSRVPNGLYILRMAYSNDKSLTQEEISMTRLEIAR